MRRLIILVLLIVPLILSCPIVDPFTGLEGVDLLNSTAKDFTDWAVTYSKSVPGGYDYLEFTEASADAGTTVGLTAGSAIYRLELVNLVQNGDFEAALDLGDWTAIDQAPLASTLDMNIIPGAGLFTMTGDVLHYNITDPNDYIDLNLITGLNFLENTGSFILRFNLKSVKSGGITFEQRFRESIGDAVDWSINITNDYYLYNVPADFDTVDGTFIDNTAQGSFFSIGASQKTGTTQEGYIDNLRAGRADVQSCIEIDIPWEDSDRANALSGYYRFSVLVKNDPSVTPTTANRIPSEGITLCVSNLKDGEKDQTFSSSWLKTTSGNTWDVWTKIYVDTSNSIQIDPPESGDASGYNVIKLNVSPTDTSGGSNTYDIGSLLIAEPRLEYSSNRFF